MLRKISGPVESIRSIAITTVSGSSINLLGNTRHETALREGGEAVQLRTGSMANIHPGDLLNVAVLNFMGTNRVVAWHAPSTGARGTVAVRELAILSVVGPVAVLAGAVAVGLAALAAAGTVGYVQAKARRLVS